MPKNTGTHADVFATIGLAEQLNRCGIETRISDEGIEYRITSDQDVTKMQLASGGNDPGYLYLLPNEKSRSGLPVAMVHAFFDYPREKERFNRAREAAKQQKAAGKELAEELEGEKPHLYFNHYRVLNLLQGDGPLNYFATEILDLNNEAWVAILEQNLKAMNQRARPDWALQAGLVQLFHPLAAKGYSRLKPDSTSRNDKTKDGWADSFTTWLTIRGYFHASLVFLLGDDIRILTVEPGRIGYGYYSAVLNDLRAVRLGGTSIKVDCLGTLAIAIALVRRSTDFPNEYGEPAERIGGILSVQYKSLGSAKAVTELARLGLPGWYRLATESDRHKWLTALDEHVSRLRQLDDSISDELQLLILYRKHLEQRGENALHRLTEFMESYGIYVIRKRGQDKWHYRQFSALQFEDILMTQSSYADILTKPGFRAVAQALRSATVSAQALKRNKQEYREIRYDLLPELRRKRSLPKPDEFIEAVAGFIAAYNSESAKRLEQEKKTGTARVSDEDFADFISLFERGESPSMIGSLLCAYATCKASNEAKKEDDPAKGDND